MPEKKIHTNNHTARMGENFNKEIEEIKKHRKESGIDKNRRSTRELTDLIIKHSYWKEIKEDMLTFDLNKNGE